ncbi:hypothetical protein [Azospirillum brasilense]|nr:hypothetical protein [Azospirillum brasilense]
MIMASTAADTMARTAIITSGGIAATNIILAAVPATPNSRAEATMQP